MKSLIAFVTVLSSISYSATPVLEIRVGRDDPENQIKKTEKCVIYADHKKISFDKVVKLNEEASRQLLVEAKLKEPEVPSYHVFGYKKDSAKEPKGLESISTSYISYLLKEVSVKIKQRKGSAAQDLIELAEELCDLKHPRD